MSTPNEFLDQSVPSQRRRITDIVPTDNTGGFEAWHDLNEFVLDDESIALKQTGFRATIAGAQTNVLMIEPLDSARSQGKRGIIIDPGFLAPQSAYLNFAKYLARSGSPTAIFAVPTHQSWQRAILPANARDAIRLHSQMTLAVSRELLDRHESNPDEKLDYVAHSLGNLVLSQFVDHKPEYVNKAISMGGAGLYQHGFGQMALRSALAVKREIIPYVNYDLSVADRVRFGRECAPSVRYFGRKLREGYHAATGDATARIIRARRNGISYGSIWFSQDTFFPPCEVTDSVKALFDETLMLHGNHLAPQNQARETSLAVRWMLDRLGCQTPEPFSIPTQKTAHLSAVSLA